MEPDGEVSHFCILQHSDRILLTWRKLLFSTPPPLFPYHEPALHLVVLLVPVFPEILNHFMDLVRMWFSTNPLPGKLPG